MNDLHLFRDPLDPRELDFSSRNPSHTGSCANNETGNPRGIWNEKTKTYIEPSGTVKQGRRPMFKPFDKTTQKAGTITTGLIPGNSESLLPQQATVPCLTVRSETSRDSADHRASPSVLPVSSPEKHQHTNEKTLARSCDPATSKAAAKTVKSFLSKHEALIIYALQGINDGTFYEIATAANLEPSQVWRRLSKLEERSLIETTGEERKGPTGRMCRVWRLK